MSPLDLLDYELFDNTVLTWGTALAVFLGLWFVLLIARAVFRSRLSKLAERRRHTVLVVAAETVGKTKGGLLFLIALAAGMQIPVWPPIVEAVVTRALVLAVLLQLGVWASTALATFLDMRRERRLAEDPGTVAAMDMVGFVLRVGVWTIVLLLVLDNFGVSITALVAGLGIGGIALALAAQNVLGDLFASLSIVLDKPFVVGDFLIIGDYLGTVEKIGIKTTRLRSLSGEQLIFSNNDLLGSRIRNYKRMYERRVVFSVGVTYQTPAAKLRRIPEILREAVEAQARIRFDRSHFQKYGDFALIFETVYYVLAPEYNVYMDIQQAINVRIYEQFEQEGIEFAYPTQTLFIADTRTEPVAAAPQPE